MAFRRQIRSTGSGTSGSTSSNSNTRNTTEPSSIRSFLNNTGPSSSPTRPLLTAIDPDDNDINNNNNEDTARAAATMMEEGQSHNEALIMQQQQQLNDISNSPYMNAATFEPTEEELKKLKKSQQRWNLIVFTVGYLTFFFALGSMLLIPTPFVIVCFITPLILGPYIVRQRRFIIRFPTLRRLINRIRFQANRLQVQNNKFAMENTRLEGEIQALKRTEFQLHQLCQKSGSSIQEMQQLIQENGAIQKEMKVRSLIRDCECVCLYEYD